MRRMTWLALTSICVLIVTTAGAAEDQLDSNRNVQNVEAKKVSGNVTDHLRASELTGMTVKNEQGKSIGSVNDFVVDFHSGKIRYLAVSYGGFLGLGDKLFAVPLSAFETKIDPQTNSRFLVTQIDEERLKNAPGFDQNNWPDFADPSWKGIDEYYTQPEDAARQEAR